MLTYIARDGFKKGGHVEMRAGPNIFHGYIMKMFNGRAWVAWSDGGHSYINLD